MKFEARYGKVRLVPSRPRLGKVSGFGSTDLEPGYRVYAVFSNLQAAAIPMRFLRKVDADSAACALNALGPWPDSEQGVVDRMVRDIGMTKVRTAMIEAMKW